MTWTNDDGLIVKFGTEQGTAGKGGSPVSYGNVSVLEFQVTATTIGSSAAVVDNHLVIPSGAVIHKVEVIAETACTSGDSATLDVGLIRLDRSTELDYNGLVAALALTSIDADGDVVELIQGSTGHGDLVGTALANAGVPTINYGTAAYTAGVLVVKIYYYMP